MPDDETTAPDRRYEVSDRMRERIANSFRYHRPFADQGNRYDLIRQKGREFAEFLVTVTPESREQSLALTALEEVVMRANQSIALNEGDPPVGFEG